MPLASRILCLIIAVALELNATLSSAEEGSKKPFTVADEIGITLFQDPNGGDPQIGFSPDGNYFAVWSERGRLDLNRVEDSLRVYRTHDVNNFLQQGGKAQMPSPAWNVVLSTDKEGPIIENWRWAADSSGIAFVQHSDSQQFLAFADLQRKTIEPLTSVGETAKQFDVADRNHYVYTAADPTELKDAQKKTDMGRDAPVIVGTGANIDGLLFPEDPAIIKWLSQPRAYLWAVTQGKRSEVKHDGKLISPDGSLSLSPDGGSVVTKLSVPDVPSSWETLYPPPFASSESRLHAGKAAQQFVRIDLKTGTARSLTEAPTSDTAGWWWGGQDPSWSSDGKEILLPGTFVKSKDNAPSRPCVAIVDVSSSNASCVETLKIRAEEVGKDRTEIHREPGFHVIEDVHLMPADDQHIVVNFRTPDWSPGSLEYQRTPDGSWQAVEQIKGEHKAQSNGLQVGVKQSFDEAPLLVVSDKQKSQIIWDPNPQLKNIEMGEGSVYTWKDKEGREWKGGLYKPVAYAPDKRYPLVIQTHGFNEDRFLPAGGFPTAFAARALAANGIMVLQIVEGSVDMCEGAAEPACGVSMLESAANQLVADGLVDQDKIGAIGFSRTVFQVMEQLTTGSLHLKAASITDGVMFDYFQYMLMPERMSGEGNTIIGAPPFGDGLQLWLKRSPGFNLDRITTPLLVNAEGRNDVLFMWLPYAGLRYLKKPVDLIVLNTDEHVLTNPAVRIASQGGSVDWFRFWLQDYEDPDPAKAAQYKRWHELKKMQAENEKKASNTQARSD